MDGEENWPHPVSVEALLTAFGMPELKQNFTIWTEPHMGKERRNIVNVIAPFLTPTEPEQNNLVQHQAKPV